jgi:hypothetical protein
MSKIISAFFGIVLFVSSAHAQVRNVTVKSDDILTVKTALGIATIIQLPETIGSAIIGDQSGFKVEYLDRAVTIKPLRWGVKTNLYLVTEKRRYNIRLLTLSQESADYIVYVKAPDSTQSATKWVKFGKSEEIDGAKLTIRKIGFSESGFILIDATLSLKSSKDLVFKPEAVWIKQGTDSKVINGLFLSKTKLSREKPILIGISLARSDLKSKKPVTVELQLEKKISVTVSEDVLWK